MHYLEENKFLFKANPTNQMIHWRAIKEFIKDNNSSGGKDTFYFTNITKKHFHQQYPFLQPTGPVDSWIRHLQPQINVGYFSHASVTCKLCQKSIRFVRERLELGKKL